MITQIILTTSDYHSYFEKASPTTYLITVNMIGFAVALIAM